MSRAAASFLRSALADRGETTLADFDAWFERERRSHALRVERIAFRDLDQWEFAGSPKALVHRSGKFFTIEGLRVETDFGPVPAWDQPIIRQPEIGILGIVTREMGGVRHFLMQAKVEPGNVDGIQLAPTVQATRSNYTRVHGGALPALLEYFVEPGRSRVLVDQLQGEQTSRFLGKRNRNLVIEVDEDVPVDGSFCWLTLGQLKRLLRRDNVVNMDSRSVLACVPLADLDGDGAGVEGGGDLVLSLAATSGEHSTDELLRWLSALRARHEVHLSRRPIDDLQGWSVGDRDIRHESGRYFSVIAVSVEATTREVRRWSQPLLDHPGRGLNGFVLQRRGGVLHFLVRACLYPGNRDVFELGPTVSRSNVDAHFGKPDAPPYLDLFRDPAPDQVRFASVQSEEGRRFYHYKNPYVLLEV